MNIRKAKVQIQNAIKAYLTRNELGGYAIPAQRQRPVFLIGPPGIGKTAIMQQIAAELGIGLISYSMTHHTRQSAIGLPFIAHRSFEGREFDVTEYTMSEIIASIYELMEETGIREGILFLDEINCVSETLSPLMLQFLQYKVFGRHRIPDGWIIVAAGNPPEYNDSVRDFDIVTLDRLKKIEVEPDYEAWRLYASESGIHPSVTTFLESRRDRFYSVETTVSGRRIVTPRGWEDLSEMIFLYELNGISVDEDLIVQYLQDPAAAKEFAVYYDLFRKYQTEYPVSEILGGTYTDEIRERLQNAGFDEVYTLIGLLLANVREDVRCCMERAEAAGLLRSYIQSYRDEIDKGLSPAECMKLTAERTGRDLDSAVRSGSADKTKQKSLRRASGWLRGLEGAIAGTDDPDEAASIIKSEYARMIRSDADKVAAAQSKMTGLLKFAEECWGEDKEMLMIVTELTADPAVVRFISRYGCEEYFRHNHGLLANERQTEIDRRLEEIEL